MRFAFDIFIMTRAVQLVLVLSLFLPVWDAVTFPDAPTPRSIPRAHMTHSVFKSSSYLEGSRPASIPTASNIPSAQHFVARGAEHRFQPVRYVEEDTTMQDIQAKIATESCILSHIPVGNHSTNTFSTEHTFLSGIATVTPTISSHAVPTMSSSRHMQLRLSANAGIHKDDTLITMHPTMPVVAPTQRQLGVWSSSSVSESSLGSREATQAGQTTRTRKHKRRGCRRGKSPILVGRPSHEGEQGVLSELQAVMHERDILREKLAQHVKSTAELELENSALRKAVDSLKEADYRAESVSLQYAEVLERLVCCLRELENKKQSAEAAEVDMDIARLGRYELKINHAHGTVMQVWRDGLAVASARLESQGINEELEQIHKQQNKLGRELRAAQNKHNGTDWSGSKQHLVETEEILKLRAKELSELGGKVTMRIQTMEREIAALQRRIRRAEIERASPFLRDTRKSVLHHRYVILSLLGKGGFSEVYKAFDLVGLQYVACKVHQVDKSWDSGRRDTYLRCALRETNLQRCMSHPRVVRLFDMFDLPSNTSKSDAFCTVLELCEGGDLESLMQRKGLLAEAEAKSLVRQVLSGLCYLHNARDRIIHYDIKPANILFDYSGQVKLSDFGLSKRLGEGSHPSDAIRLSQGGEGTYWYLPPECFPYHSNSRSSSTYSITPIVTQKVDVWSVGVIAFEMMVGRKPFAHNKTLNEIWDSLPQMRLLWNSTLFFPSSIPVSPLARGFINRCLTVEAGLRPSAAELLEHPWLSTPKTQWVQRGRNTQG